MSFSLIKDAMPELIAPALAAGLTVAATHVPLGREVLRRGIIFLDLAVAQIAALGAAAAILLFKWEGIAVQGTAFFCAISAAIIFSRLEKNGQAIQEAFIGCAFVLAASLSILLFANDPHGGEEISHLLAGQILWVSWHDIVSAVILSFLVLGIMVGCPKLSQHFFYVLFAASITFAVQMVGIYLVFASLILPSLASSQAAGKKGLAIAYLVSVMAVTGGLAVSILTDLPSGPVLVCSYIVSALLVAGILRIRLRKVNQA